jgi:thiol-disulfide isomerase/thioredoxin
MRTVVAWLAGILVFSSCNASSPGEAAAIKVGEAGPAMTLRTLDGRRIDFEELRGKVVVLNFWATWCVPCRAELPLLEAYQIKYEKAGLAVFAIAGPTSAPASQLKKLQPSLKLTLAKLIGGPYKPLTGVPTNYVIDRRGIVRHAKAAALDSKQLDALLLPLLRDQAGEQYLAAQ